MNTNNVLGVIIAGCLMVIAYSIVKDTTATSTLPQPLPETVTYTPVKAMPIRERVAINQKQFDCLATNLYFEARNQKTDRRWQQ